MQFYSRLTENNVVEEENVNVRKLPRDYKLFKI